MFVHGGGGLHPGRGVLHREVCIQGGGLHPGGSAWGGGIGQTPPLSDTTGYGQRAGDTQPTGMYSHYFIIFLV